MKFIHFFCYASLMSDLSYLTSNRLIFTPVRAEISYFDAILTLFPLPNTPLPASVPGSACGVKYFSPSRKSLTAAALPNERVDKAKYTGVSAVPHFPTHQLSFSCRVIGGSFCHCHLLLCPCLIDMAEPFFFCIGKERRQLWVFTEKDTVIP